jgi:putative oxidoreductase
MRVDRTLDARWGVTAVRAMMGVILIVAGAQKWTGGINGTIAFFTQLGIPAPQVVAPIIASGELLGGLLLLLGLGARPVALWFLAEFIVTAFYVKLPRQGWDAGRIDLMLLIGSVMLLLVGAGAVALDDWLDKRRAVAASRSRVATVTR